MRGLLNLARRPLRNERLPTLLLVIGCLALVGVTAWHALLARDLLPERTAAVDGELVALEDELDGLRREAGQLESQDVAPETLEEWAAVRRLVDHRTFVWSALMASLEEVTPPGVRLVSITPAEQGGKVTVTLLAEVRSVSDGLEFLDALQAREEFRDPFPNRLNDAGEEIQFDLTVEYAPAVAPVEDES